MGPPSPTGAASSVEDVLAFWFGEAADEVDVFAAKSAQWFAKNADVDAEICARFGTLRESAIAGEIERWRPTAHGTLALIILVDQFSRNLFRDDARAFAHDSLARGWASAAVREGVDRALRPIERVFLYLPFEHSEALADQDRSVALFTALRDAAPSRLRDRYANFLDYANRHRDVIERFGRFPHRNAALGRASTAQELIFLDQPGTSF